MELSQHEPNQVLTFPFHLPIKLYMYRMNLNYALVVKQDLDKLLVIRFIEPLD
jgi:hypothetical protein